MFTPLFVSGSRDEEAPCRVTPAWLAALAARVAQAADLLGYPAVSVMSRKATSKPGPSGAAHMAPASTGTPDGR